MGRSVFRFANKRLYNVDTIKRVVFSLGDNRRSFVYRETISYSLGRVSMSDKLIK